MVSFIFLSFLLIGCVNEKEVMKNLSQKNSLVLFGVQKVLNSSEYQQEHFLKKSKKLMEYVQVKRGLVYKKISNNELVLDLYLPKNNQEKLPVVFYIHGGMGRGKS